MSPSAYTWQGSCDADARVVADVEVVIMEVSERFGPRITVVPRPTEAVKVVNLIGNVTVAPVARTVAPVAVNGVWTVVVTVTS